jgi:hypothetical protein
VRAAGGSVTISTTGNLTVENTAQANDLEANGGITLSLVGNAGLFKVNSGANIQAGGTGSYVADKIDIQGSIMAPGQIVALQPFGSDAINLGSTSDVAADTLELSDAELDRITAGTLRIGDGNAGSITISEAISTSSTSTLHLINGSGSNVIFSGSTGSLNAGEVTIVAGNAVISGSAAIDIIADTLSITTSGGGIAAPVNPLTLSVNSLVADSGPIGGSHNFSEVDSLMIGEGGLRSSEVRLVNGAFITTALGSLLSAARVFAGARLEGAGSVAYDLDVLSGGTLSPGASPGILSSGHLTFASGAIYKVELNGGSAGTGYDQVAVNGNVKLNGATLNPSRDFLPAIGTQFVIIDNDGVDAVLGTFAGLAEGAKFDIGGKDFTISYVGGTGNDVVLSPANQPPVASGDNYSTNERIRRWPSAAPVCWPTTPMWTAIRSRPSWAPAPATAR